MSGTFEIHPKIGVARLGNSPKDFYLSPRTVGGLPVACDAEGTPKTNEQGEPIFVTRFKDDVGQILRQAATFKVVDTRGDQPRVLSTDDEDIIKVVWTVHIANKKPIWFTFSELLGDLEFGPENSYEQRHVPVNNSETTCDKQRKALIIDPGPRTVSAPGQRASFSRYNIPESYAHGSFPPADAGGQQINELGELRVDKHGHLVVLGGHGNVTGSAEITSFRGASGYWDDISDGYVQATIHFADGSTADATPSWVLIGSPKYAPELVNITTLYDTMFDVAVRFNGANAEIFPGGDTRQSFPQHQGYTPLNGFNPEYKVNYTTQIAPILDRIAGYRWVADIPYLVDFTNPRFDLTDASEDNRAHRQTYFDFFRVPVLPADYETWIHTVKNGPNQLFNDQGQPLMPLNSGDNSVTNAQPIYKFETLSATQYFFMTQWAAGKFYLGEDHNDAIETLTEAAVGNCVGAPLSPGIETTWIVRNPALYTAPMRPGVAHFDGDNAATQTYYSENGLSIHRDEALGGGCEPGDLTKRMAIPWQADFQDCTVQTPNITNPLINQFADGTGIEVPPAYYVYWWPPQSPMHVVAGSLNPGDQVMDAAVSKIAGQPLIPAGQRVPYQRGIVTVQDMIDSWGRLGFVVNQGTEPYPYFVETERNSAALLQIQIMAQANKT